MTSTDEWSTAVLELQDMNNDLTPSHLLRVLLFTAKTIVSTVREHAPYVSASSMIYHIDGVIDAYAYAVRHRSGAAAEAHRATARKCPFYGWRRLLPGTSFRWMLSIHPSLVSPSQVFTFVLVRARLSNPLLLKHLLSSVCHSSLLQVCCSFRIFSMFSLLCHSQSALCVNEDAQVLFDTPLHACTGNDAHDSPLHVGRGRLLPHSV